MRTVRKAIFGKNVHIEFEDVLADLVAGSVGNYADSLPDDAADIRIVIGQSPGVEERELLSRNPSVFQRRLNGVTTKFSFIDVSWVPSSDPPQLLARVFFVPNRFRLTLRQKLQTMEYSTEVELFEQVLHERVLVPAMYFFGDRVIVHAAAVAVSGRAVLLTGTGGTGKTSGLLALRRDPKVAFLSDDIAVMAPDGGVFANLAWPKIYGYNLGSSIGRSELLGKRGFIDRLHFTARYRRNPSKVRRKLRPGELYANVATGSVPLGAALFLFRESRSDISVEQLPVSVAADMSIAVMNTEYFDFHRFFHWDEFNSLALGMVPLLNLEEVVRGWRKHLLEIFSRATIRIVRIPLNMPHDEYLSQIKRLIIEAGDDAGDRAQTEKRGG